jgi:hypothetical protein
VGLDIAGAEDGFPAEDHKEAYQYAQRNFLQKTVHAGEAAGPESIHQAITKLFAGDTISPLALLDISSALAVLDISSDNDFIHFALSPSRPHRPWVPPLLCRQVQEA